ARNGERIVERGGRKPFKSTRGLVGVVAGAIPRGAWPRDIHVATRSFQAFRIAVNRELEAIEKGLKAAIKVLVSGGRVGVVSFHSLEGKIAKYLFNVYPTNLQWPPRAPDRLLWHLHP